MKRVIALSLALMCALAFCAGCDKPEESSDSAPSVFSTASDYWQEESVDTSLNPIDPATIKVSEVPYDGGAQTFTVTDELREEYFDILSQHYSQTVPLANYDSLDELSINEKIHYGIFLTVPYRSTTTSVYQKSLFILKDIQKTVVKYLGVQIPNSPPTIAYVYQPQNDILEVDFCAPTFAFYFRLSSLSVDESGLYSAVFDVSRSFYVSDEHYTQTLADAKAAVCGAQMSEDYPVTQRYTVTFRKMTDDETGEVFLRFMSKSNEFLS